MNYEVFELLEAGSAGDMILEKCTADIDELCEPIGIGCTQALDE